MQYESPISSGLKVMTKVKVFVHAANADADGRAMTLAPRTFVPAPGLEIHALKLAKCELQFSFAS